MVSGEEALQVYNRLQQALPDLGRAGAALLGTTITEEEELEEENWAPNAAGGRCHQESLGEALSQLSPASGTFCCGGAVLLPESDAKYATLSVFQRAAAEQVGRRGEGSTRTALSAEAGCPAAPPPEALRNAHRLPHRVGRRRIRRIPLILTRPSCPAAFRWATWRQRTLRSCSARCRAAAAAARGAACRSGGSRSRRSSGHSCNLPLVTLHMGLSAPGPYRSLNSLAPRAPLPSGSRWTWNSQSRQRWRMSGRGATAGTRRCRTMRRTRWAH